MPGRLDREDVLLLIASGAYGSYSLDPVRLMKGAFLVSQRGLPQWRELFNFQPYDYGPFDSSVYRARDSLLLDGLLSADHSGRYESYELTPDGQAEVSAIEERIGTEHADWFRQIGRYVTTRSFATLLREIYAEYPSFATRSVMTH